MCLLQRRTEHTKSYSQSFDELKIISFRSLMGLSKAVLGLVLYLNTNYLKYLVPWHFDNQSSILLQIKNVEHKCVVYAILQFLKILMHSKKKKR